MKTFKQFMEQVIPTDDIENRMVDERFAMHSKPKPVPINLRGKKAFGFGRPNQVTDFNDKRYRDNEFNPGPALETQKRAPAFNAPSSTMKKLRRYEVPRDNQPSGLM
jgi:hypothetical protein